MNSDIQNVDKELEKLSKRNDKLQETLDKELEEKATGKETGITLKAAVNCVFLISHMHTCIYTLNIIGFQAFEKKNIAGPSKIDKTLSSNEPTKPSVSSSSSSSSPVPSSSSSAASTSKDRIKIRVTKLNKGEYQKNALKSTPGTQKLEEDVQDQLQKAGLDLGGKLLCFLQHLFFHNLYVSM